MADDMIVEAAAPLNGVLIKIDTQAVAQRKRGRPFEREWDGYEIVATPLWPEIGQLRQPDGTFIDPPVPPPNEGQLLAYAGKARWQREVGGITVAGMPVSTDDRSKTLVMGALLKAQRGGPDYTTMWSAADGQSYPVDTAAIEAISDAMSAFVDDLFVALGTVRAAVLDGSIADYAAIDAAFQAVATAR